MKKNITSKVHAFLKGIPFLGLASCVSPEKPYLEYPVSDLFQQAHTSFNAGDYTEAADSFEKVDQQHPHSPWSAIALVRAAYACYKAHNTLRAVALLDTFLTLYPAHPLTPYTLYLRMMSYGEELAEVTQDTKPIQRTLEACEQLLRRFPNTPYGAHARTYKTYLLHYLAAKEMSIARFYEKRNTLLSALGRYESVATLYPQTVYAPEAFFRMVEHGLAFGMQAYAKHAAAQLEQRWNGSFWHIRAMDLMRINNASMFPLEKALEK